MTGITKAIVVGALLSLAINATASAADVVNDKSIGMELARDIANEAVMACRRQGYHVSVVVVDRFGLVRAALRDDLASRFTLEIAERKANLTVMAWTDSGAFRKARPDIQQELNHIEGLVVMEGGVRIVSGGYNLGAVGVSGAPGGERDAACAKQALEKLVERIEFAVDS
ncbi:MAG: heme-binding protein [Gammaproteobacteria bacterium]|nr:heme-binding protein [Gammaproteobacteria bacterium]